MTEISKYTPCEQGALLQAGVMPERVILFAAFDMTLEDDGKSSIAVLTDEGITVIEGEITARIAREKGIGKKRVPVREFALFRVKTYPIKDFTELTVEEEITTATLFGKSEKGDLTPIARASRADLRDLRLFAKYYKKYLDEGSAELEKDDTEEKLFCPKCGSRYPDPARKICPKCMEGSKLLKRLFSFTKGYRLQMAAILFTLVLASALGIFAPYLSASVLYDKVLTPGNELYGRIVFVVVLIVLVDVMNKLVGLLQGVITARVSSKVVYNLKRTIFDSIQRLSLSFFTGRQTGGLMNQINNDGTTIYWFFVDGVPYFLINAVQFVAVFIIMLIMNPLLAIASVILLPLFAVIVVKLFRRSGTLYSKRYASSRSMNGTLSDALTGFRVVKAFSREKEETARFGKRSSNLARDSKNITYFNNTGYPFASFVMYLSNIIVWAIGGWLVMSSGGDMTYGTLVTFLAYVGMMNAPMFQFVDMTYWFSDCMNAMQRLFEIADAEPDVLEPTAPADMSHIKGKVEFKDVKFGYVQNKLAIDGISFEVEAGKTLGIVGHTGAGKSTLANLLMRLYDVGEGEILIDGVNVKDISGEDLKRNIAIVSQETYFFVGTIAENIRYAAPEASMEEVIAASKIAGAHDFIMKLPDGYETKIGFVNKDLSGGEKQRLSIARAILSDPKILILDEATAAMDTQTERRIQAALTELSKGRTTITIAHRLSTLRDADSLIVIENGKMPEAGTHDELIRKKGIYYKLYKLQLDALKNVGVEG